MAVPITSAGGLFVKLGHDLGIMLDLLVAMGYTGTAPDYSVTFPSKYNTLIADYQNGTPENGVIQGVVTAQGGPSTGQPALQALATWQNAQTGQLTYLQSLARCTLIDMVNLDASQPNTQLGTAMAALINNTLQGSYHVTASSPSAGNQTNGTPTPNAPYAATGNTGPVIVMSLKDGKGNTLDNVFAETLKFTTTADAQSGGATKWQEPISAVGQSANVTNTLSYLWPAGAGANSRLNCVNSQANQQGGNLLQNSAFLTFTTANVPDNWTITVGTAGTQVLNGTGTGFVTTNSLKFVGDSSTLTAVIQNFNTAPSSTVGAGGTSTNLLTLPDRPFAVNFWYKLSSASPAAGVLEVALVDSTGTVINDDAGTANSKTVTLSAVADTSWHNVNAVFRMPAVEPTNTPIALRLRLSTALTTGTSVFLANLGMTQMTQLPPTTPSSAGVGGGPFWSVFAGNLQTLTGDNWTVALGNTWGNFIQGFQRLFGMSSLGLRLPTSGGSAIDDVIGSGHLIS